MFIGLSCARADLCPKTGHFNCVLGFRLAADVVPEDAPTIHQFRFLQQKFLGACIQPETVWVSRDLAPNPRDPQTYRLRSGSPLPKMFGSVLMKRLASNLLRLNMFGQNL